MERAIRRVAGRIAVIPKTAIARIRAGIHRFRPNPPSPAGFDFFFRSETASRPGRSVSSSSDVHSSRPGRRFLLSRSRQSLPHQSRLSTELPRNSINIDKFTGFFDKFLKGMIPATGCYSMCYSKNLSAAHSDSSEKELFHLPRISPQQPAFSPASRRETLPPRSGSIPSSSGGIDLIHQSGSIPRSRAPA